VEDFQILAAHAVRVGGEGRNRPDFPAVAIPIYLILLAIQALPALSDHIIFNRFGVRFGVRLTPANLLWNSCGAVMEKH
jgi:hypothetical protein